MSLDTYAHLITAIGTTLNRSDVSTPAADWVLMVEADLNRTLKVRPMVGRDTATISNEYEALPTDWAGPRAFNLQTDPITPLDYVSPDELDDWRQTQDKPVGKPKRYSIVGGYFRFSPAPDTSYTAYLTYWKTIPALVTNLTNWLLTAHPDVYLYGSLMHAGVYLKDPDMVALNGRLYAEAVRRVQAQDDYDNTGNPPRMRVRTFG